MGDTTAGAFGSQSGLPGFSRISSFSNPKQHVFRAASCSGRMTGAARTCLPTKKSQAGRL